MKNFILILLFLVSEISFAQRTVGLIQYDVPNSNGYILFSPIPDTHTYLIDKCGTNVHQWSSNFRPALSCYLLEDGSLLRTGNINNPFFSDGGSGGIIEKFDWDDNITWTYQVSDSMQCQHHDIRILPNGNILAIVWDKHFAADAILNGRNPSAVNGYVLSEKIVELQPVGSNSANLVWEWRVWDHLVQNFDSTKNNYGGVSLHPELIDLNFTTGPPMGHDWIHLNSIDYNPALDQILLSAHNFNEVWIIDHSTTTAEASTHSGGNSGMGGDLMYRWGNVQAYDRGTQPDQKFFGQHHATWIPQGYPGEGKIIVFNNGNGRPGGNYSSIDMFTSPLDSTNHYPIGLSSVFMPAALDRSYTAPVHTDFYGGIISGVYPLQNGSFMVTTGPDGIFFELDPNFNTVWKYINPVSANGTIAQGNTPSNNAVFRCNFYADSYPAFSGVSLTTGTELELNPLLPSLCTILSTDENERVSIIYNRSFDVIEINSVEKINSLSVWIYDAAGRVVNSLVNRSEVNMHQLNGGVYIIRVKADEKFFTIKFVK